LVRRLVASHNWESERSHPTRAKRSRQEDPVKRLTQRVGSGTRDGHTSKVISLSTHLCGFNRYLSKSVTSTCDYRNGVVGGASVVIMMQSRFDRGSGCHLSSTKFHKPDTPTNHTLGRHKSGDCVAHRIESIDRNDSHRPLQPHPHRSQSPDFWLFFPTQIVPNWLEGSTVCLTQHNNT
jgi:hypothetical protein